MQIPFQTLINWNKTIGPNYVPEKGELRFDQIVTPGQFGILTGFIIILFLNYKFENKVKFVNRLLAINNQAQLKENIWVALFFVGSLMVLPLMCIIFIFLWVKKSRVEKLLKNQKHFKGMLSGPDLVWSCEADHSKAVINILAYVEVTTIDKKFAEKFLDSLKQRFIDKLVNVNHNYQKMFYRRAKEQEYHYWTNNEQLSIHDYVRSLEPVNDRKFLSEEAFAKVMSQISNENLPGNNSALWEILVGQQIIRNKTNGPGKLPIIFRVHHALGDGVALLRLLLEVISDKTGDISELPVVEKEIPKPSKSMFRDGQFQKILLLLVKLPYHLFEQIAQSPDRNSMDCENFSGHKVINWIYESETNLISIVKHLKNKIPGVKFSDILLTALSRSLKKYFEVRNQKPPKNMMVAIPARLCHDDKNFTIHNKFSVALRDLPIHISTETKGNIKEIYNRIDLVKKHGDDLNNSIDYFFNCWMMEKVFVVLPESLLKMLLDTNHATMAISNLPGPVNTVKVNGHQIVNIGFFIPNIGKTAVGVSILSYGGKLHFGMMADNQAVKSPDEIKEVLDGMVWEVLSMATILLKCSWTNDNVDE